MKTKVEKDTAQFHTGKNAFILSLLTKRVTEFEIESH